MTNLRKIIDEKGLKLIWIADKVGHDVATVSRWASGEQRPRDDAKRRLSKLLGKSIQYLFYSEDEQKSA